MIVVDLSELDFMDVAGFRALLAAPSSGADAAAPWSWPARTAPPGGDRDHRRGRPQRCHPQVGGGDDVVHPRGPLLRLARGAARGGGAVAARGAAGRGGRRAGVHRGQQHGPRRRPRRGPTGHGAAADPDLPQGGGRGGVLPRPGHRPGGRRPAAAAPGRRGRLRHPARRATTNGAASRRSATTPWRRCRCGACAPTTPTPCPGRCWTRQRSPTRGCGPAAKGPGTGTSSSPRAC